MRTLVIDSATDACSVALFEEGVLLAGSYEIIGRGHAERLLPMIAELPAKGRAESVCVSLGPGSFTGIRIGLAAARALGLAWRAEVFGYPTLALVAAMARDIRAGPVTVCMAGGHGEWFLQDFGPDGLPQDGALSLSPTAAAERRSCATIAGSKAGELMTTGQIALDILPDARRFTALPPSLLTPDLSPLYGRPPDAHLPAE